VAVEMACREILQRQPLDDDAMTVEAMIHYMLEEWGTEPMVINSAYASRSRASFATTFANTGYGARSTTPTILAPADETLPGHAFYTFEGRHYDAEAPEGVEDWRTLPIFLRAVGAQSPASRPG
jgi:hypothetical protein